MSDRDVVLRLLRDTAAAHGDYEKTELAGVFDEQWPEWYASYFTERLHDEGYTLTRAARPGG